MSDEDSKKRSRFDSTVRSGTIITREKNERRRARHFFRYGYLRILQERKDLKWYKECPFWIFTFEFWFFVFLFYDSILLISRVSFMVTQIGIYLDGIPPQCNLINDYGEAFPYKP